MYTTPYLFLKDVCLMANLYATTEITPQDTIKKENRTHNSVTMGDQCTKFHAPWLIPLYYTIEKLYLVVQGIEFMKEISVIVFTSYLPQLTEILRKHKIAGMSFHEIHATGRTRRAEVPDYVMAYNYGKRITPDTEKRTKVQTLVPDTIVDSVVQDLVTSLGSESDPAGIVYVNDVSNAHLLGTNRSGESLLIKD